VPIVQEAGYAPGAVWTGAENILTPPGFVPRTIQPVTYCHEQGWGKFSKHGIDSVSGNVCDCSGNSYGCSCFVTKKD